MAARGVRLPLDECGGHVHEIFGRDEHGNVTLAERYHYHPSVESGLSNTLEGTPGGPYIFNAFRLAPNTCWRGDVDAIPHFWDAGGVRAAAQRDVRTLDAEGNEQYQPLASAVDYEELRPCCGMVHYYAHSSLYADSGGIAAGGASAAEGEPTLQLAGWGTNAPHPPSMPPKPVPPLSPAPPFPPPDETVQLITIGAGTGAGAALLAICSFFAYLYRRYDGTDQWRGGLGPEPPLGTRWTRLDEKPTEALGLRWTQLKTRPNHRSGRHELNKHHAGTVKLREALEAKMKMDLSGAAKEMAARIQASKAAGTLADVVSRASAAAGGNTATAAKDAVITIDKAELEACNVRGLKWDCFIEVRSAKGGIVWLIPAPDPNEFRNAKLRHLLEMGVTRLDRTDWDKLGIDRATLSYDSWIEVDMERNFIKQRAWFKPTPKLAEPRPISKSGAEKLAKRKAEPKSSTPTKQRGKPSRREAAERVRSTGDLSAAAAGSPHGGGDAERSAFTPPAREGQPSAEAQAAVNNDDERYWHERELEWREQQVYQKHREWRTRHAAQQQQGWKPPRSPHPTHTHGGAPPPPAAVAVGAAFLAHWQQQAEGDGRYGRQRHDRPHPRMSCMPFDDEDSDSRSPRSSSAAGLTMYPYQQSPYQGMRAPYRV